MILLWLFAAGFVTVGVFVLKKGRPVEPAIGAALVGVGLLVGFGGANVLVR